MADCEPEGVAAFPAAERQRRSSFFGSLLVLLFLAVLARRAQLRAQDEAYVERITGLSVSGAITDVHDNAEHYLLFRAELAADEVRSIRRRARGEAFFLPDSDGRPMEILVDPFESEVPPRPREGLMLLQGCTESNAWLGLLDPSSHVLWMNVFYPDWRGDAPGCAQVVLVLCERNTFLPPSDGVTVSFHLRPPPEVVRQDCPEEVMRPSALGRLKLDGQ